MENAKSLEETQSRDAIRAALQREGLTPEQVIELAMEAVEKLNFWMNRGVRRFKDRLAAQVAAAVINKSLGCIRAEWWAAQDDFVIELNYYRFRQTVDMNSPYYFGTKEVYERLSAAKERAIGYTPEAFAERIVSLVLVGESELPEMPKIKFRMLKAMLDTTRCPFDISESSVAGGLVRPLIVPRAN